jgi:hypothetical protein
MLEPFLVGRAAELGEPRLQRLFQYWDTKKASGTVPLRAEINPAEVRELLGFLNLYDVRDTPRDYFVRLNGSEVASAFRRDITGMLLSEAALGETGDRCRAAFDMCIGEEKPVLCETSLSFCGNDYLVQSLLALPLSRDGERADMLISAHSFRHRGYAGPLPRIFEDGRS